MNSLARFAAGAAVSAMIVSACGGAPASTASASPASSSASAATAIPTATKAVVPATAQGSASTKLTENKVAVATGVAPDLAAGNYLATVSLVTLEKGGRTVAHKHGGIESIYVLEGTVDFRTAGGTRVLLTHGQGAAVPPGTALQAINAGDGSARFLAFFMTAEAATFQTNVDEAP